MTTSHGKELIKKPSYAITSVDHALRLIQMLRDVGQVRVSDAAVELDVAASTVHRLLAMLVYRGFAIKDDSHAYAPGPALGAAPALMPWTRLVRNACRPHMELLSDRVDETVNLMFRVGAKVRFLETVESTALLRIGNRTGSVLDANRASGGKALLAELGRSALERLYRSPAAELAGETLSEVEFAILLRELDQIGRDGFGRNDQETETGVSAIGFALHDATGSALAAFTISAPTVRRDHLLHPRVLELARGARADMEVDLARQLGPTGLVGN
ncbi:IclR family transcriptional regulator [Frondihabitans cladoniiphilus]|uniref:IclR family transcriptional regulator n=1 Tax=Frondihabitans cladoniiphilus TaxID=715785 RepID=A0ABP8WDV9_9MICO